MNYEQAQQEGSIVYEDDVVYAIMPKAGAIIGHTIIYLKEPKLFAQCSDEEAIRLYAAASIASSVVFEGLKAQGTNIIMQDGKMANGEDQVAVHVMPRKEGDGLNFMWEPKEQTQEAIQAMAQRLSGSNHLIDRKEVQPDEKNEPEQQIPQQSDYDTVMQHMTRYP